MHRGLPPKFEAPGQPPPSVFSDLSTTRAKSGGGVALGAAVSRLVARYRILLLAVGVSLATIALGLLLDVNLGDCDPILESCAFYEVLLLAIFVTPWLVATVWLARKHSITVFAVLTLGIGWAVAACVWYFASTELNLDRDCVCNNDISEMKWQIAIGFPFLVSIGVAATFILGVLLQAHFVRVARRSTPPPPAPAGLRTDSDAADL